MRQLNIGDVWEHHTGRLYRVEGIARENDLGVDFVVHRGLHDGQLWVRSVDNFLGKKGREPRFICRSEDKAMNGCNQLTPSEK